MRTPIEQLPDDIETLKRLIIERDALVEAKRLEVVEARLLIEKLKLQIARYKRIQFGRTSERHDERVAQLELIVEELEANLPPSEEPAPASPQTNDAPAKDKPARRPLPEHLPRTTQEHAPACGCPACGTALRRMGEDVSEQLEFIPEHFKVIRHVRPKFACGKCQNIVQAAAPSRPIVKGIAGPGLLAHVAWFGWPLILMQYFQVKTKNLLVALTWSWPVRAAVYVTLFYLMVVFGAVDGVQFIYFQF